MENGFLEHKQWLLKSLDSLLEAAKEHDQNLNTKIEEVKGMITDLEVKMIKALNDEALKRQQLESDLKIIENDVSRRTTLISVVTATVMILGTILINVFLKN